MFYFLKRHPIPEEQQVQSVYDFAGTKDQSDGTI